MEVLIFLFFYFRDFEYPLSWPCRAHVVFIPGIRFSILNELTFQVTWLQMTRHSLHLYVGVVA